MSSWENTNSGKGYLHRLSYPLSLVIHPYSQSPATHPICSEQNMCLKATLSPASITICVLTKSWHVYIAKPYRFWWLPFPVFPIFPDFSSSCLPVSRMTRLVPWPTLWNFKHRLVENPPVLPWKFPTPPSVRCISPLWCISSSWREYIPAYSPWRGK